MAKTLITQSVVLRSMGSPENITIFNCDNPKKAFYTDISKFRNRVMVIYYSYDEDGTIKKDGKIVLQLKTDATETEMRDFIINEINKTL